MRTRIVLALLSVGPLACGGRETPELDEHDASETANETEPGTGESGEAEAGTGESETGESSSETGEHCNPLEPDPPSEREFVRPSQARDDIRLSACEQHLWWTAAAAGSELTLALDSTIPIEVAISYPDQPSFVAPIAATDVFAAKSLTFVAPRSGEFALLVRPINPATDPSLTGSYQFSISCTDNCRETTRFPVLLVHGWTGFENIGPLDYFYGVRSQLETYGYPVAVAVLDPYNSVEVRGAQLAAVVDATLGAQRARKLDVIAHSQGGLDSRRMISGLGYGDRVGALITVATPHRGTPVTDIALGLFPGSSKAALFFLLNLVGASIEQQSDAEASFYSLSETYVQETFNPAHPDDPQVRYWSWTGATCLTLLTCDDAVDLPLLAGYELLAVIAGPNDGLVTVESAKWGEFLGVIPADHFDQIGQIGGLTGPNFDHVQFYLDNARMLRSEAY